MVADEAGIVIIQKPEGPVVQGESQDGHIVRVHDSVGKANGLPFGHQPAGAGDDLGQELQVLVTHNRQMGEVMCDDVIRQQPDGVMLVPVVEHFERSEADVAGRQAHQHRTAAVDVAVQNRLLVDSERLCADVAMRVKFVEVQQRAHPRECSSSHSRL